MFLINIFLYKQQFLVTEFMKRGDWKVFFISEFFYCLGVCFASFWGYVHLLEIFAGGICWAYLLGMFAG